MHTESKMTKFVKGLNTPFARAFMEADILSQQTDPSTESSDPVGSTKPDTINSVAGRVAALIVANPEGAGDFVCHLRMAISSEIGDLGALEYHGIINGFLIAAGKLAKLFPAASTKFEKELPATIVALLTRSYDRSDLPPKETTLLALALAMYVKSVRHGEDRSDQVRAFYKGINKFLEEGGNLTFFADQFLFELAHKVVSAWSSVGLVQKMVAVA